MLPQLWLAAVREQTATQSALAVFRGQHRFQLASPVLGLNNKGKMCSENLDLCSARGGNVVVFDGLVGRVDPKNDALDPGVVLAGRVRHNWGTRAPPARLLTSKKSRNISKRSNHANRYAWVAFRYGVESFVLGSVPAPWAVRSLTTRPSLSIAGSHSMAHAADEHGQVRKAPGHGEGRGGSRCSRPRPNKLKRGGAAGRGRGAGTACGAGRREARGRKRLRQLPAGRPRRPRAARAPPAPTQAEAKHSRNVNEWRYKKQGVVQTSARATCDAVGVVRTAATASAGTASAAVNRARAAQALSNAAR